MKQQRPGDEVDEIAMQAYPFNSLEITHFQLDNECTRFCFFAPAEFIRVDFKQTQSDLFFLITKELPC